MSDPTPNPPDPEPPEPPLWTLAFAPNPSDPNPVVFSWDDVNHLACTNGSMLDAAKTLANTLDSVWGSPTGPSDEPDTTIPHLAFAVVLELGLRAGLELEDMVVEGDGWEWPEEVALNPPDATPDATPDPTYLTISHQPAPEGVLLVY